MKASLPSILPDFTRASVLVLGDVMLDRYFFGDAARISPEAPVPVVNIKGSDDRPGGAANVALNIAALGAKIALLGITGKDEASQVLMDQLASAQILLGLQASADVATITKQRVMSRHQQLIRLDFEKPFTQINETALLETYCQHLPQKNVVVLSDYGKGTLSNPQAFISAARKANVPVLVDPKGTNFDKYRHATLITPNFKEFEAVVGVCSNEAEILSRAQTLIKQLDLQALLLTRGDQGMTLIEKGQEVLHLPAYAREVYDVTGAGDTVIAFLAATLGAGSTLPEAVAIANLAASIVVTKLGTATVTIPELEGVIKGRFAGEIGTGVVDEEQLLMLVQQVRTAGKKVVFTNGCFDILHAGHVAYLQQAKQLGDYLIVAINGDESVKRLKGSGRPVNPVEHRALVLAGLGVVDWVVAFDDDTPERLLRLIKPDVLVKGGDYTLDQVVGAEIVRSQGGEIKVLRFVNDISTTSIINRMVHKTTQ